ncbi:hypothetical protein POM88_015804 [Heracleum sosnowskyi]|uniref:DUF4216 domain-containing protein n=1 Tax=Heracleum sosnowskyi TaxID=360622 RepID=A0AAD8IMM7_9APIA|nr:hypothetical protein POM88_015804 [Heracleum sosnowskyi]
MSQYSESPTTISNTLKWLAYGPDTPVTSYEGYDVNGGKSNTSRDIKKSYYGVIEEIWELDYKDFKVTLFKCKWFDDGRGVRVDESGFTLVDFSRFPMDENSGNTEPSSSKVSRKRTRGPSLCKKLKKKKITNQNLECSISFNEFGRPIGDMLKDFRIYLRSVVRCQVDINIESWDLVNQGLKDAIRDAIKLTTELASESVLD